MLPILNLDNAYRPSANWAQLLARKLEAVGKYSSFLPAITKEINHQLLVEQVSQNLLLGDIDIARERVSELVKTENRDLVFSQHNERIAYSFANAVGHLQTLINNQETKSNFILTLDLLRELHTFTMEGVDSGGGFLRCEEAEPLTPKHQPPPPDLLPMFIDNALDWFSTSSFAELHPVEQAWLVHLRLMELQPFAQANGRVIRLVASLYTLRADLCPIIVNAQDRQFYYQSLASSLEMITQPGIELFAQSLMRTLDQIKAIAETSNR
jgi:Fic family protein